MRIDKMIKIAGLNVGIAVVDTILFSPGLLGIQMVGASTFATALGATAILMSVLVFIFGNYKLLTGKEKVIQISDIKTTEDYFNALEQNYSKKTFEKDIATILKQIERFQKKQETIKEILLQKFDSSEMSYSKFNGVISEIENLFYINIKSILNKLNAFDEVDYNHIRKEDVATKCSNELLQTKLSIYKEYISFVRNATEDNEQIILKLDQLLLEISKFNSLEDGEIEKMNAIKEIDELINKVKFYK